MSVALVKMMASCGLSPHVVENSAFQAFIETVQSCPSAHLPTRKSLSRDKGKNGIYLDMALQDARNDRERVMKDIHQQCIAGNIMADCAKSISRTTNVTLLKAFYRGHVSTALMKHTSGSSVSKTGEWLFKDLREVIESMPPGSVFIVILDGAILDSYSSMMNSALLFEVLQKHRSMNVKNYVLMPYLTKALGMICSYFLLWLIYLWLQCGCLTLMVLL
jgi:hypothetical protein